ncbi:hypothetical protein [Agromyces bauzanensis]
MRAGIVASAGKHLSSGITGTYQATVYDEEDRATYTFSAQPIGAAASSRRVVVAIGCRHSSGITLNTVTIGGVAATKDVTKIEAGGINETVIASAVVPTGTTADVVVTFTGGSAVRCTIGVWTLTGGSPATTAIAAETDPTSLTLSTSSGDFVVAAVTAQVTVVWSGASERFNTSETGNTHVSGADAVASGASTVISVDPGGTTGIAGCGVAYA